VTAAGRIDVHTHGIPRRLPALATRYAGDWPELVDTGPCAAELTVGGRFFRSLDDRCWDASRRLEDMDAEGVTHQVVSPIPVTFSYHLPAAGVAELARIQNEWIADLVRNGRGRFLGLGTIPLQSPACGAEMVAEVVGPLGLSGVEIASNVDGVGLDQAELDQVYSACEDTGALLFVHPWQVLGEERLGRHGLMYSVGMPAETAAAAATLVLGGVLDRHPRLRVVLAHGGGAFLSLLPRIDRCTELLPGVTGPQNRPSDYARRFWYDSLVYDPDTLAALVRRVGSDRVMVGTDYPFPIGERPAGAGVEAAGLDAESTRAVLSGTASGLFGV
jgi:aminocarboxymuconate-semialdehyde decarboxylase